MKGDYAFAKKMAIKNRKFIASQKEKHLLKDYLDLWALFNKLCDVALKKENNSQSLFIEAERLNKSFVSLYANLPVLVAKRVLFSN